MIGNKKINKRVIKCIGDLILTSSLYWKDTLWLHCNDYSPGESMCLCLNDLSLFFYCSTFYLWLQFVTTLPTIPLENDKIIQNRHKEKLIIIVLINHLQKNVFSLFYFSFIVRIWDFILLILILLWSFVLFFILFYLKEKEKSEIKNTMKCLILIILWHLFKNIKYLNLCEE